MQSAELCSVCNGLRSEPGSEPERCTQCNGSGELRRVQQSIFGQFVNVAMCDRCRGEGRVVTHPCKNCKGVGREKRKRKLSVKIPAASMMGHRCACRRGRNGQSRGAAGQPLHPAQVKPHEVFRRDEDDLILDLDLNFAQVGLGDEVDVPTIDGEPHELRIPAGTQTGETFVVRGKGVPHLRGGGRGDMIVHVNVVTPKNPTKEQKDLLKRLAESLGAKSTRRRIGA